LKNRHFQKFQEITREKLKKALQTSLATTTDASEQSIRCHKEKTMILLDAAAAVNYVT
jgi:hypothetical protein